MADDKSQQPTEEQTPIVDDTPISGRPNVARKNSLEAHLQGRPERSELVESKLSARLSFECPTLLTSAPSENILPESTAAPGLLAHQKEVSASRRTHPPGRVIAKILSANICHVQLKRHMLEDQLNDKISHRPDPEALIKEGVLQEDPRSPEERYKEAIEDEYAKREGGA